jgi:hypothetical protein
MPESFWLYVFGMFIFLAGSICCLALLEVDNKRGAVGGLISAVVGLAALVAAFINAPRSLSALNWVGIFVLCFGLYAFTGSIIVCLFYLKDGNKRAALGWLIGALVGLAAIVVTFSEAPWN